MFRWTMKELLGPQPRSQLSKRIYLNSLNHIQKMRKQVQRLLLEVQVESKYSTLLIVILMNKNRQIRKLERYSPPWLRIVMTLILHLLRAWLINRGQSKQLHRDNVPITIVWERQLHKNKKISKLKMLI